MAATCGHTLFIYTAIAGPEVWLATHEVALVVCVNTPAVFLQALTLAPLFVWFELLFLLGYKPQLYSELQQQVNRNIAKLRQKGKPF